ncbi:MAG: peptide-methionine (S)-S-oxide reductase MsrA [Rhodovibrionaceae bacterium]
MAVALFASGCFWKPELAFRKLDGVSDTAVGYSGGHLANPSYQQVCNGDTGHTETVRVEFDPAKIFYEQLLEVFWSLHDPTQVNRQGPDVGSQYRSAIFTLDTAQQDAAEAAKAALEASGRYRKPVATEIVPAGDFWRAEDYHQQYLEKRSIFA